MDLLDASCVLGKLEIKLIFEDECHGFITLSTGLFCSTSLHPYKSIQD